MSSATTTELMTIDAHDEKSLQLNTSSITATMESLKSLRAFVAREMIAGVDYGQIPGTGKNAPKVLLQPGAQKTSMLYNCRPAFRHRIKELPNAHREITARCQLIHRGTRQIAAEGWGACSTMESKYRYRTAKRQCPACGSQALIQTKGGRNPGGYWCPPDRGGCGGNFQPGDPAIEKPNGKVENPDIADVYNTVLKMADKRAFVAAAINLGAMSELFTQDLDDDVIDPPQHNPPEEPPASKATPRDQARTSGQAKHDQAEAETARRKAEVNNSFAPAAPTADTADFKQWMMRRIGDFNADWQLIMMDHGIDEPTRKLSAEATTWNRAVNGIVSQALALNELDLDATLKDGSDKRDPARVRLCAEWLLERKPAIAQQCWERYAADKLARLKRELGITPREPGDDA